VYDIMPSTTGDIACAKVLCAMGMIPDNLCVCGFMLRVPRRVETYVGSQTGGKLAC